MADRALDQFNEIADDAAELHPRRRRPDIRLQHGPAQPAETSPTCASTDPAPARTSKRTPRNGQTLTPAGRNPAGLSESGRTVPTVDRTGCTATRHGTYNAYNKGGCTCPDARKAWTDYCRAHRNRTAVPLLLDARTSAERLRILAGLGYDWRCLARLLGYASPRSVTLIAHLGRRKVQRSSLERIRQLYNTLIVLPAPQGPSALRAINTAQRNGWGLVDLEVVHRALAGQRPELTTLERKAVIFTGAARGMTHTAIAQAANTNHSTVTAALAA